MLARTLRAGALPPTLTDGEVDLLRMVARVHGVEPWLTTLAVRSGRHDFQESRRQFVATQLGQRHELDRFAEHAHACGATWVVLKGLSLAETVYPERSARIGADVDVLVDPASFRAVIARLVASGWYLVDRNWPLLARTLPGQLRLRSPIGVVFDLHWHVLNNPALRSAFSMPTPHLLARREVTSSGLPMLGPNDLAIHVALHAAMSGANRLTWLADTVLATQKADSAALADRSRAAGADLALHLVCSRAERWLGMSSPAIPSVPARFRAACAAVDSTSGPSTDPDAPALARSFARSVRATPGETMAEFGRHLRAFLRPDGKLPTAAEQRDPNNVASPLLDCTDSASEASFYREVVATPN